jgi:hypothetical protein
MATGLVVADTSISVGGRAVLGANLARLVLISTTTVSDDGTVDITSGFGSSYDMYMIHFTSIIPVTDTAQLLGRLRQSSTFRSDSTYDTMNGDNASAMALSAAAGAGALGTGSMEAYSGMLWLMNPNDGTNAQTWRGYHVYKSAGAAQTTANMSGYYDGNAGAIDGFQIFMSSGNVNTGTVELWGYAT